MERKLARGLEALLGRGTADIGMSHQVQSIPVTSIRPNPCQPRHEFDEAALSELKDSIERDGLLQPIVVRRVEDGYELIAGERRWRACSALGMAKIPALVRTVEAEQQLVLALVENIQRRDLNAIEEAAAFRQLLEEHGLTHEEIAQRVGRERSTITNTLRLLDLPESVQGEVSRGTLSAGHARTLLPLLGTPQLAVALTKIRELALSVRQTEALVRELLNPTAAKLTSAAAPSQPHPRDAVLTDMERRLQGVWNVPVQVRLLRRGAEISLRCSSREELNHVLARLEAAQDAKVHSIERAAAL